MLEGQVRKAMKLIDADSNITGVHELTDRVRQTLQEKHLKGQIANSDALSDDEVPRV